MESRYKFRPVELRGDTTDIKEKCYVDSFPQKETGDSWNTLYNDTYVRHPLESRRAFGAPKSGVQLGGGPLAPTKEEMNNTNYGHYFNRTYDSGAIPKRVEPMPESDFMPREGSSPCATVAHLAMEEAVNNRPPYDNTLAKERVDYARKSHFFFGDNAGRYETNYSTNFKRFPKCQPSVMNPELQKSHICFDKKAGLGPHARQLAKKGTFPEIADPEKPEVLKKHFDVGYEKLNYSTTMEDGLKNGRRGGPRPESFKAHGCAQLSDHGAQSKDWETTNRADFRSLEAIPNKIDQNDLRKTHWDTGHDPNNWQRNTFATAKGKPKLETIDLQSSNTVFKGDGTMTFNTTAGDLLGKFNCNEKAHFDKAGGAYGDHLFLGGDNFDYLTTSQEANKMAGKGRPASMMTNLHLMKGTGFARGGAWDQYAEAPTDPDEKIKNAYYRPKKYDARWFHQSHFDLDSTDQRKGRYETTYFEEICRPKIF